MDVGALISPPKCNAKDAAGSCPNCFSHDDPNDLTRPPALVRTPGGTIAVAGIRTFTCPILAGIRVSRFRSYRIGSNLLRQLERLRRTADEAMAHDTCRAYDAQRDQALRLILTSRPGKQNPFDLTQEPDRIRDGTAAKNGGKRFWLPGGSSRPACAWYRSISAAGTRIKTPFAI